MNNDNMEKSSIHNYVIAAVVSLAFVGSSQMKKDQATDIGNLPATNAHVETNSKAIIDLTQRLTAAIEAAEEESENSLKSEAAIIRAEINRREIEMREYIATLDSKSSKDNDRVWHKLESLEDRVFDHSNSPEAEH